MAICLKEQRKRSFASFSYEATELTALRYLSIVTLIGAKFG